MASESERKRFPDALTQAVRRTVIAGCGEPEIWEAVESGLAVKAAAEKAGAATQEN